MTLTSKQIVGLIIGLTERLDEQDKIILQSVVPSMQVLHDRLGDLEQPKPLTKTGDEQYDALIDDLARKDQIITSLFELVTSLQDELAEIKAHVFKDDRRLGHTISFDRMSR